MQRNRWLHVAVLIAATTILTACGAASKGSLPVTAPNDGTSSGMSNADSHAAFVALNAKRQADGEFTSPVAAADSFTNESGLDISDSDIDRFIDKDVTGNDRALAMRLMRLMPKNRRGDFLYLDGKGTILSNRDAIKNAYLATGVKPPTIRETQQARTAAPQSQYPPVVSSNDGGAYLREYSVQGITAGFGFVTIPCGDELIFSQDEADTYFGENGEQNGSTEGGLATVQNPNYYQGLSIQLYGRSTALKSSNNPGGYGTVQYPTHYNCGTPIELVYGQLQGTNQGYYYASASLPQYSPLYYSIPDGNVLSTNVSYVYLPVPSDFSDNGSLFNAQTPCRNCFMRRNTTIAQQTVNPWSGECFGFCHGQLTVRWDQIYMGQLVGYNNTPSLISLTLAVTGTSWYGGIQVYPDGNRVQHSSANLPSSINFDYEGINLSSTAPGPFAQAAGSFGSLKPIPATPSPRPINSPNPCIKNPRICESPIRTPTPAPTPSKKP